VSYYVVIHHRNDHKLIFFLVQWLKIFADRVNCRYLIIRTTLRHQFIGAFMCEILNALAHEFGVWIFESGWGGSRIFLWKLNVAVVVLVCWVLTGVSWFIWIWKGTFKELSFWVLFYLLFPFLRVVFLIYYCNVL
jgi:hypothetical protein